MGRVRSDQWAVELSDRLCECGCGERTKVIPRTDRSRGWVKGAARRFVYGHQLVASSPARPVREPAFKLTVVKVRGRRRCSCGCGSRVSSKNARYARGHAPVWVRPLRKTVRWIAEDRGFETPCHIWQLGVDKHGYGKVSVGGKRLKAHRVAFQAAGNVIPAGHDVHHRCEVKLCVNAEHLQPLTPDAHGQLHGEVWRRA